MLAATNDYFSHQFIVLSLYQQIDSNLIFYTIILNELRIRQMQFQSVSPGLARWR